MECLALQPLGIMLWEYHHLHRYLLAGLSRLERDRIVVTGAGPSRQRYRMRLSWQGHTECVLGIYEPNVIRALRKHLRVGDTCLDVGGHVGYLAIFMAHLVGPGGCVVAFEPVPETFEALRENIRMNGLENVRLECTAVGEQEGTISLFCDAAQELSWTPSVSAYRVSGDRAKEISAPVLSLDGYLEKSELRPSVVKIDVEGAELAVLRGARRMLLDVRPVVLVEIHDLGARHRAAVMQVLDSCNYAIDETASRGRETFCLAVPRRPSRTQRVTPRGESGVSSRERILHRMVRSNFVRRAYGACLPIPMLGPRLRRLAYPAMPSGKRLWIRIPQGLGAGLWMFADLRIELGYANGRHEPWLQDLLKAQLGPGDCYYDLGAHSGFFSLIAGRQVGPSGAVLAVEPDLENAKTIQANAARNKFAHVAVLQAAVWSSNRQVTFEPASNSTQGRVSSTRQGRASSIGVPAICLDNWVFRERRRAPDFIKMDVEGAEWEALHGARRLLSQVKPKLLCEIHDPAQLEKICALLAGHGYRTEICKPADPHSPDYHQLYVWAVPRLCKAVGNV